MTTYEISNRTSGAVLGLYEGDTEQDAILALCRDAGYASREEEAEVLGKTVAEADADLLVVRVVDPDAQCREHGCAAHACTESH